MTQRQRLAKTEEELSRALTQVELERERSADSMPREEYDVLKGNLEEALAQIQEQPTPIVVDMTELPELTLQIEQLRQQLEMEKRAARQSQSEVISHWYIPV